MKLALVHMRHSGTGGTERYLNQIAAHMAARGHVVTVVCRTHEAAPHPAVRFAVVRPFAVGSAWRMWAFAQAVQRHVEDQDYDVVFGLGKTWTHDVIRLGGGCHATYLALAHPATLTRWERLTHKGWLKHRLALRIERRALAPGYCARVITNSELVKRDAVARYALPPERVAVVYNGVDPERFHPRRRDEGGAALRQSCGFDGDDVVVLFLGTGYGRKGLGAVLEAFPPLLRTQPRAKLLVVGYDSAGPRFERQAHKLGLGDRVRFLGGRRDAETCFAAADVYALPTHYDPFANSTLEALATGLPVITTAANGASELLTAGVEGTVLASPHDVDKLGDALAYWSTDGRARRAAAPARALAERYSHTRTAEATATILEDVAATLPWQPRGAPGMEGAPSGLR